MSKQRHRCASHGLQKTWTVNLVSWHKYILPIIFEKNSNLVFLIDNFSFAWWFCVYFLNRHWRHEVHILWRPSLAQRLLCLLILPRLFGWQRLHYRRQRRHFSWIFLEHSGQMMSLLSVIKSLQTKEPQQDEQTKQSLFQWQPSKDMNFEPCVLT